MNLGILIVVAIMGLWALSALFGMISGTKPFSTAPGAMDSSTIKAQAQQSVDDTEAKRKQMMDDMKQKIEDAQKKY